MTHQLMPFDSSWCALVDSDPAERWYRSLMANVDSRMDRWLAPSSAPLTLEQTAQRAVRRVPIGRPDDHGPIELDDNADPNELPGRGPALARKAIALGYAVRCVIGLSGGRVHKRSASLRAVWTNGVRPGYPRLFDLWVDGAHQYGGLTIAPGNRSQLTSKAFGEMLETIAAGARIHS